QEGGGPMSPEQQALVGSWRLISCEHRRPAGGVDLPFGPNPKGRLVYMADGRMIVLLTDPARAKARSPQFFEASVEELGAAAAGCVAYSGTWRVRGGDVVHEVEQSLFPNWSGGPLVRAFRLDGDRLTLTTGVFLIRGEEWTAALVW